MPGQKTDLILTADHVARVHRLVQDQGLTPGENRGMASLVGVATSRSTSFGESLGVSAIGAVLRESRCFSQRSSVYDIISRWTP